MQKIIEFLKDQLTAFVGDVEKFLAPGVAYIEANGGVVALDLATVVLQSFSGGATWVSIVAAFTTAAEKQGITLAEDAAGAVLNAAKLNLLATGQSVPASPTAPLAAGQAVAPLAPDAAAQAVAPLAPDAAVAAIQLSPAPVTNPDHPDFVAPV